MKLTELDYKILEFIGSFDKVKKYLILEHFSNNIDAIEYRLELLAKQEYRIVADSVNIALNNTSYILEEYITVKYEPGRFRNEKNRFYTHNR